MTTTTDETTGAPPGGSEPAEATGEERGSPAFASMTPRQIVEALDEYVIGQDDAKRAVSIALRNRWRRQNVPDELREEILPNNIVMIGPTGVGKTEIARRLARLAGAPFVKVEASKFTEVGYMGRDVESMVRDLVDVAINMVREEHEESCRERAEERVEERLLDLLLPPVDEDGAGGTPGAGVGGGGRGPGDGSGGSGRRFVVSSTGEATEEDPGAAGEEEASGEPKSQRERTREKIRSLLRAGKLEDRTVEVEVTESSAPDLNFAAPGMEGLESSMGDMLDQMMPKKTKRREMSVGEAREILMSQELESLIDEGKVKEEALDRAQRMGIIFLDEIDKVVQEKGSSGSGGGPDVSREGVQRDMLPIVEGSTVQTKHGMVNTEHVLFIAAGAFHVSDPSDLIPELQGRFPIRVELDSLGEEEFVRILQEPRNALLDQYRELVRTEDADLEFEDDAIREIARIAAEVNETTENIGARRLQTVMSTLLDPVMFGLPEEGGGEVITIDADTVRDRLSKIVEDRDLRRYIL
ncbi:MAG: ATP-dependent protease ATPase subunit HslU [Candidatus Palauibacterales bacterium]|nr:ATP-dependent protease ATPase subunit HslU [Candidatus Palauibacterales bacterium]